jgi:hypothetical protein
MRKVKDKKGFSYSLDEEILKDYQKKPVKLRLKWLYMGNLLRKGYGKNVIARQDKFREGKM